MGLSPSGPRAIPVVRPGGTGCRIAIRGTQDLAEKRPPADRKMNDRKIDPDCGPVTTDPSPLAPDHWPLATGHSPLALPRWLKRNVPKGNANHFTAQLFEELRLATVCDHARCPNRMECYAHKTATFMILGEVCTRRCGFCHVAKGKTQAVDPSEPLRVAEACRRLGLEHVVITRYPRRPADGGASTSAAGGGRAPGDRGERRGPALGFRRQPRGGQPADRGGPRGLQPQHRDRAPALPPRAGRKRSTTGRWRCSAASRPKILASAPRAA